MKLDFIRNQPGGVNPIVRPAPAGRLGFASGETDPLTDVLLFAPSYLEPVPCCSVTREQLRDGFAVCRESALAQHAALVEQLTSRGVTCHLPEPVPDAPDLCFARDVAAATPFGLVALRPALPHRRKEVERLVDAARELGITSLRRIEHGTIEGGDICIARPGLLILGCSGERTDEAGARAFAAPFREAGWDVLTCRFDPHFLHLDTMFCMLDANHALACTDVLADSFLDAVRARGIELIPVTYKEARGLGCNILSLDGRTILIAAGHDRVRMLIERAGFEVVSLDLSNFTACGGGVHCLTMPLARRAAL